MSTEALVLAATTVIRPTGVAAVLAMLAAPHPRRLLMAYIVAGLAFSVSVGTLVVVLLGGLRSAGASPTSRPALDLLLGAGALACAAVTAAGRGPRWGVDAPDAGDGWMRRRLSNMTPPGAAAAGVLTHLPGVVYLAALNAIARSAPGVVSGLLQVGIYNAIWFSLAVAALVLSIRHPAVPRQLIGRAAGVVQRRQRAIITCFCGGLGGYLLVSGLVGLGAVAA
ncbi:MAG TPA: GAP family protein [Pseudonocardia sp.]|jgi:hypothetical protein|uniref:GAP family protein n=1 Tax=Pseudonocardia sp. TaxID=60912 RepID=UPI002B4B23FD|nr:GAP family protein [Pseudonocardia sp.]HLU58135.1 GAP family protein [Pseudonocardia sp.]